MTSQSEYLVIGAGLAGLNAALTLHAAGKSVTVLEADSKVGGRVQTDTVDGFLLDRGFQILNPGYPELQALDVLHELDLREFTAGIELISENGRTRLADPRKKPAWLLDAIFHSYATPTDKLATMLALAKILQRGMRGKIEPSLESVETDLAELGIPDSVYQRILKPFLTGVFLADPARVSASYGDFVLRSFINATPAVPARGMGTLPQVLADRLPQSALRLNTKVESIQSGRVFTDQGEFNSTKVILAVDVNQVQSWFPNLPSIQTVGCTTWYHAVPYQITDRKAILIDADARGPILNSVAISAVAPGYASRGRSLISTTTLGDATREQADLVKKQLRQLWGESAADWELIKPYEIPAALPLLKPGSALSSPVKLGNGIFVAGDHRDTPSQQGALLSGRRAALAALK